MEYAVTALAAFVGIALANLGIWLARRRRLDSANRAARRALLQFVLIDTLLQSTFLAALFCAALAGSTLVVAAAGVLVAIAKVLFVDAPLERWRDARVGAAAAPFAGQAPPSAGPA